MITFQDAELRATSIHKPQQIIEIFYKQGFVIVDANGEKEPLSLLAKNIGVGEPIVSNYNKNYFANKIGKNKESSIGINEKNKDKVHHKVFEETGPLEFHVDGTFSPLAEFKTTLLHCKVKALKGGESTLFNAYEAIKDMESDDINFGLAFRNPKALLRKSTFTGIDTQFEDCVLGFDEDYNREAIRVAFDSSGHWEDNYDNVNYLKEAKEELEKRSFMPKYSLKFTLEEDQVIIMDNTRICHGRMSFENGDDRVRTMVRTVHTLLPS